MGLAVVILAGGRATRMGGGDKPLKVLRGVPILSHVLARVARHGRGLVLNANGDASRFAPFGLPVVADAESDFPGPLAGILAGLDWAAAEGMDGDVLSVPGDCPFIPHDLAERLEAARRQAGLPLACAGSGGWTHPVIGLWPVSLREELRAAMAAGERKIDRFTARFGCATAEWPVEPFDPFFNVNTPDELAEAERLAALVAGAARP
ncbi:MAG: molybdenum cofactor guanylyltransferase MobA [Methylobacterium sp.]|jgi:molybdopterin-guanine dinucleotide biosynthesis protein A|nr:molybdenum cofactor guanylyltransferase MobA [Methylobacterium sp.]MCA3598605.1 molybdenum cofactor guanylyltransferase MobA [Methylobacterium sp.]MCA3604161.1 molybdenum cofactor guanylyltransferase MobA [Methylobacterium sp.]MCA3615486.1 molybdenum cofactor guanylyltransferase MobA [Methylobacterium sp.]MCA3624680.1 molybdenum cofactor guanylyltransferase MobA [Methylobacterium sp.]